MNLAFIFSHIVLKDACNLFYTCQGMAIAFIVRLRFQQGTEKSTLMMCLMDTVFPSRQAIHVQGTMIAF
jgi:hypothetical protein